MVNDRIQAAAAERAALLRKITAAQHAKPALGAVQARLADLQQKYRDAVGRRSELAQVTVREKAAFDALQNQYVRRWFQDRGARQQQLATEEAAYLAARGLEDEAAAGADAVDAEIKELRVERDRLRAQIEEGGAAEVALEALYGRVFSGPTRRSPDEDALETRLRAVQTTHGAIETRLLTCGAVSNALAEGLACITRAATAISTALDASADDTYLLGNEGNPPGFDGYQNPRLSSTRADFAERDAMRTVQIAVSQAEGYVATAQQLAPDDVGSFYRPAATSDKDPVDRLDFWIDIPITDFLFLHDLKTTQDHVAVSHRVLSEEVRRADERHDRVRAELAPVKAELDALRKQIFALRAALFAQAMGETGDAAQVDAPPPYARV